jgi:hypothetical protein
MNDKGMTCITNISYSTSLYEIDTEMRDGCFLEVHREIIFSFSFLLPIMEEVTMPFLEGILDIDHVSWLD